MNITTTITIGGKMCPNSRFVKAWLCCAIWEAFEYKFA